MPMLTPDYEVAARHLQAQSALVLQGLPLVGKRPLAGRLARSLGLGWRHFRGESGTIRPVGGTRWLPDPVDRPAQDGSLFLIEDIDSVAPERLWQQCRELLLLPQDRLILLSDREVVCPLENSRTLTLRPLNAEQIAALHQQLGAQTLLSRACWMDLADHLGGISGLLAYAAQQLVTHPQAIALGSINARVSEWTQSICDKLPEVAIRCLKALARCAYPLSPLEGFQLLEEAGCLEGLELLHQHFLLETGPNLSLLEPLRESPGLLPGRDPKPLPGSAPDPRSGSEARQCRRLWHQAFGLPQPDLIQEAEAELQQGHWAEARRLYRFADLDGALEGWAGCILVTLLLGQLRKASEALQRPGLWRTSTRYPYAGLRALQVLLQGEPQSGWNWLQKLPCPLPWWAHCLGALMWEVQRLPTKGRQELERLSPEGAIQQAWQLWIRGKLEARERNDRAARRYWDQALHLFAEEGHLNGLIMVQVERLQLDFWVQHATSPACLQSWLCLAQQLGNTAAEVRIRLLRERRWPTKEGGLAHALERAGDPRVQFERAWLQASSRTPEQSTGTGQGLLVVHCFGNLRLRGPGGEVHEDDWPTRKAAVLFCLLCQFRTPLSDELLVANLWPEASLQQGRARLRTTLHHVRLVLRRVTGQTSTETIVRSRKTRTLALAVDFESDLDRISQLLSWASKASPQLTTTRLW